MHRGVQMAGAFLRHPLTWRLLIVHAIVVLTLAPIVVGTLYNPEVPGLFFGVYRLVDFPILYIADCVWPPEGSIDLLYSCPWGFIFALLLLGSIQWYLLSVLLIDVVYVRLEVRWWPCFVP